MAEIYLATPLRPEGRLNIETAMFCNLMDRRENVIWGYIKTFSAEMSRNNLIEDHNNSKIMWTHVLFVDSDVAPPIFALDKLLKMDADIATGIYPILLSEALYWDVTDMEDNWIPYHETLPTKPFETVSCGAGCLLVKKEVIDKMDWPYFKMVYQPKYPTGNPMKQGEDIYFSQKARDLGYKIIANPAVRCRHFHNTELSKIYKDIKKQVETKEVRIEKA